MIKKLLLPFFTVFLLGCSDQTVSIFQNEAEGSFTNFEENLHGTYASTYKPLAPENIVIRKSGSVLQGSAIKKMHSENQMSPQA